jgi:hypothetical protein
VKYEFGHKHRLKGDRAEILKKKEIGPKIRGRVLLYSVFFG